MAVGFCGAPPVIARVVDQHVQAAALGEQLRCGGHARVVRDVERDAERVDPGRLQ